MNNIDEIIKNMDISKSFLRDVGNGILLTTDEENILKRYQIDYKNCKDVKELIFKIEDYLNEDDYENDELDNLSIRLSEFNYYNNTNK